MDSQLIWTYLLIINAASFLLMGFDKLSAGVHSERIPEIWLFMMSLAGGFLGIILGGFTFRHKTRKMRFQVKIAISACFGAIMIALLIMRI